MKTKEDVMIKLIDEGYVMTNENWNYISELYEEAVKNGLIKEDTDEKKMLNFYQSIKMIYMMYGEQKDENNPEQS